MTNDNITEETIKETINNLFRRFGSPSDDASIEIREYLIKPDKIAELNRIREYDKSAAETISKLEKTIEKLKIYRIALQKQYAAIELAPKKEVIKLTRRQDYRTKKVFYYLTEYEKNMNTGAEVMKSNKKYPGTERKQAIADFEQYIKEHKYCIYEKNIEIRK